MSSDFEAIVEFIKRQYAGADFVPLHEPRFPGNEQRYLAECIDSTFVSSVGKFVDRFERDLAAFTGSPHVVVTVNGTTALQVALRLAGVQPGDLVVTQALTFVATANAVAYSGAQPVFLDSDRDTMGLDPAALAAFFDERCRREQDGMVESETGRRIGACVPVHVFGHPCAIGPIVELCSDRGVPVVEDAAESLGSTVGERHTGTFGRLGVLSFNGNKIVTTGGGGAILCGDEETARLAKHLTTTAKVAHKWDYFHDQLGYNYRMPNVNAALGCAQLESLPEFLARKRALAEAYRAFFAEQGVRFVTEPPGCRSNFWLNCIILDDRAARDTFLDLANRNKVGARPFWTPMPDLPMYRDCLTDHLTNARWLSLRAVNIPSSVPL